MNNYIPQIVRAAIYARVSSEEKKEGQSIESQVAELERFAAGKGWHIAGIYSDDGWSGPLLARPELDRLRDDAAKGLFNIALINHVDRLSRDVTHLGIIKRDLERHGVQVVFAKLPGDDSPAYNLMVNILGSFAEFERELILDRTRRGRRYKVEVRKQYLGSGASYGFQYIAKDKTSARDGYLKLVPEEAAVVRQMFEWVDKDGLSAGQVIKRLKAMKISPRKGAKQWGKSSVLRILRNEMYAGTWYYNKHESCEPAKSAKGSKYKRVLKSSNRLRPKTEWLPITLPEELRLIDRDQWQRVQEQIIRNRAFSLRNTKHKYLLRGLVECGGCRSRYVGDPNHGRFYYRCLARCKTHPIVRDKTLDEIVWSATEEAILNPSLIYEQIEKVSEQRGEEQGLIKGQVQEIAEALDQIEKEEERFLEAFRLEVLSSTQLGRELGKINVRKAALEARKKDLTGQTDLPDLPVIRQSLTEICQKIAARLKSFGFQERQRFLQLIINTIIFEGSQVRIKGIIPLKENGLLDSLPNGPDSFNLSDGIASMAAYRHSHNSVVSDDRIMTTTGYPYGHSPVTEITFELIKPLPTVTIPLRERLDLFFIRNLVQQNPQASLRELCGQIEQATKISVSIQSMSRILTRMGLSHKARRHLSK